MYITITGADYYLGIEALKVGDEFELKTESDNEYDDESILITDKNGIEYGHVANSVNTVARGTHSAGYIYNQNYKKCKILFVVGDAAIAKLFN